MSEKVLEYDNILPHTALDLVEEQAADDSLWVDARTELETKLQKELDELHVAVKRDAKAAQEFVFDCVLAKHSGSTKRREWTQYGWLYPGDMVVVLSA